MRRSRFLALAVATLGGIVGASTPALAQRSSAPPLAGPGTLVGIVTDAEHRPIADAEVRVGKINRTTRTGANGAFRFDSLATGRHELRVRRLGYEPQTRFVNVTIDGGSVAFTLKAIPQRLQPVVTAVSRGGLGGFITDRNARPLPGSAVRVYGFGARTVTDSAGEFFMDVRPGTFMLRVTKDGYGTRLISVTIPKDSGRQVSVALTPGKPSTAREEIEMDSMRKRMVWRSSPAEVFGREMLDALENKRLTALVQRVNPNPLDDTCMAIVDGGPDTVPLWYLDADEIEAVEVYPQGTLSYVTGERRQKAIVGGRNTTTGAGAARNCPLTYVWLR